MLPVCHTISTISLHYDPLRTNRIYHWSLIQTEKSKPKGKRITREMRFTNFPALSVDLRVGISGSASETDD